MADRHISLAEQIACVRREIAMRSRVYPKWVQAGRMKLADADREAAAMLAVLETLRQVERSEAGAAALFGDSAP